MDPRTLQKILYIDDTPEALSLVDRVLSQNYLVLQASEPLAGIELAIDTEPDLILLDINMPQLNGREVAARLKTLLPKTVLVAFSADNSLVARERALAAGCVGYITKPLDVDTFPEQVAEFLGGKRETLPNQAELQRVFEAELVERLEAKVRELTRTIDHNAFLFEQNQRLVTALQSRQRLLEAAARVSNIITSILDLDELLRITVNVICEEYDFYYASIFLIDPAGKYAVMRAGRGEAGEALLAEGHTVRIDETSMVGSAINQRKARLSVDIGEETARLNNHHLPQTRSEMALPLIVKDNVLGALSVQSNQANAFSDDDITALQSLANQVAIAINNARLLQDLASAHRELLRNKTFEAIATTTGQTIHWVGNKAAPIPSSSRRVREDLCNLLAVFHCLCQQHDQPLDKHPFWPFVSSVFETASQEGIDLDGLARRLAEVDPRRMQLLGGLDSILEDLAIIEQSATSIINIKEDLIGPMRLQKINDVDLTELLRRTIFEMGLPDGVVQTDFAEGMPHLQVDARQIGQVYNNLIKNAWEALQGCAGPRIVVSAHLTGDAAYIMTEVSDNGPGIAPEILEKIWISFFTTKGDRGGTGLGLSACIAIINQCDGKISVSSEVGKGTTFTVLLPVEGGSSSDNSA